MVDRTTRASRRGRALAIFAAAALLVVTPLRVVWGSEATGILGPFVMWIALVLVARAALRDRAS